MEETTAIRRILGVEPKDRLPASAQIEREYLDAIARNRLEKSDFLNISIQRMINHFGLPLFLVALEPTGMRVVPLDKSDRLNIAVGAMLAEKGML